MRVAHSSSRSEIGSVWGLDREDVRSVRSVPIGREKPKNRLKTLAAASARVLVKDAFLPEQSVLFEKLTNDEKVQLRNDKDSRLAWEWAIQFNPGCCEFLGECTREGRYEAVINFFQKPILRDLWVYNGILKYFIRIAAYCMINTKTVHSFRENVKKSLSPTTIIDRATQLSPETFWTFFLCNLHTLDTLQLVYTALPKLLRERAMSILIISPHTPVESVGFIMSQVICNLLVRYGTLRHHQWLKIVVLPLLRDKVTASSPLHVKAFEAWLQGIGRGFYNKLPDSKIISVEEAEHLLEDEEEDPAAGDSEGDEDPFEGDVGHLPSEVLYVAPPVAPHAAPHAAPPVSDEHVAIAPVAPVAPPPVPEIPAFALIASGAVAPVAPPDLPDEYEMYSVHEESKDEAAPVPAASGISAPSGTIETIVTATETKVAAVTDALTAATEALGVAHGIAVTAVDEEKKAKEEYEAAKAELAALDPKDVLDEKEDLEKEVEAKSRLVEIAEEKADVAIHRLEKLESTVKELKAKEEEKVVAAEETKAILSEVVGAIVSSTEPMTEAKIEEKLAEEEKREEEEEEAAMPSKPGKTKIEKKKKGKKKPTYYDKHKKDKKKKEEEKKLPSEPIVPAHVVLDLTVDHEYDISHVTVKPVVVPSTWVEPVSHTAEVYNLYDEEVDGEYDGAVDMPVLVEVVAERPPSAPPTPPPIPAEPEEVKIDTELPGESKEEPTADDSEEPEVLESIDQLQYYPDTGKSFAVYILKGQVFDIPHVVYASKLRPEYAWTWIYSQVDKAYDESLVKFKDLPEAAWDQFLDQLATMTIIADEIQTDWGTKKSGEVKLKSLFEATAESLIKSPENITMNEVSVGFVRAAFVDLRRAYASKRAKDAPPLPDDFVFSVDKFLEKRRPIPERFMFGLPTRMRRFYNTDSRYIYHTARTDDDRKLFAQVYERIEDFKKIDWDDRDADALYANLRRFVDALNEPEFVAFGPKQYPNRKEYQRNLLDQLQKLLDKKKVVASKTVAGKLLGSEVKSTDTRKVEKKKKKEVDERMRITIPSLNSDTPFPKSLTEKLHPTYTQWFNVGSRETYRSIIESALNGDQQRKLIAQLIQGMTLIFDLQKPNKAGTFVWENFLHMVDALNNFKADEASEFHKRLLSELAPDED